MLRTRPLATVLVALALLAGALYYAPIGSSQSGVPKLSPTPPVTLAPPPPAPRPVTRPATPMLPKTGYEAWLVALIGVAMVVAGTALRTRRRFAIELLTVVGVGLAVAGTMLEPSARPASRRRR
jgi:LPXTG-motif cell wall-anchored protein